MRPSLAWASSIALLLDACGSSSSSPAPAPVPPPSLGGTVGGQAFTPADSSALVLSEASCTFEGVTASATGLAIGFGSFTGLCDLVTQGKGCADKANATIVNLLVVRANVAGAKAPPVAPGTYDVAATTPTPDPSGVLSVAQATITKTDASCGQPASEPVATKGTITITGVDPRVTGSADVTFDDGSHVAGTFDAAVCGFKTDICTALTGSGCTSQTCVP